MIPHSQPGFTRFPNYLLDSYLGELSPNTFSVLAYIVRRTLGFNQDVATIPLNQFIRGFKGSNGDRVDNGAGIGNRNTLIACIKELESKKIIEVLRRSGQETGYKLSTMAYMPDDTTSTNIGTTPVPELILVPVSKLVRVEPAIPYSRKPKHVTRKKEEIKKKERSASTAPLNVDKYGPGGKYHFMTKPIDTNSQSG
jgi:hypothetical protein